VVNQSLYIDCLSVGVRVRHVLPIGRRWIFFGGIDLAL
jgi:hypothetical protein